MPGRRLGRKIDLFLCLPYLTFPSANFWLPLLVGVCKQGQGFEKRTLLEDEGEGAGRSHRCWFAPERPGLQSAALHCRDK